MRIAITGADGQLGHELVQVLSGETLIPLVYPGFDLLKPDVEDQLLAARPHVIIHAAAYTNVDRAEDEPDLAMAVNGEGTARVARAAARLGARLIYVSTDFVFDGTKRSPYDEADVPNPVSAYGRSKRAGEEHALALCRETLVVRTAWLYGAQGHNFVKTIMRLAAEQPALRVVTDQRGCPTNAEDLAKVLAALMTRRVTGIVHAAGRGDCTWHEFATAIVGSIGSEVPVQPITTAEVNRKAMRPAYSVLGHRRLDEVGLAMPEWHEALQRFVNKLTATARSG